MELWRQELYASAYSQEYLAHHGIKGQRWGVRRFQYEDGSLTPEGRARYLKELEKTAKKADKTSDPGKSVNLWIKGMKNPLMREFFKSTGMDEAVKRLSEEVDAAYWEMQKYSDPSSNSYDPKKAKDLAAKYNKVRADAREAYKEIGREKVQDYVGSIYDKTLEKNGASYDDVAQLINRYMGFTEQTGKGKW